jgi:hypothetical protein
MKENEGQFSFGGRYSSSDCQNNNICELELGAVTLLSMETPGKRFKRKRDPSRSFGELVQRLWQMVPEDLERKVSRAKKKQSAGKQARIRKK